MQDLATEATVEQRLDRLTAEMQDLRFELKEAMNALPKAGPKWISTAEFAGLLGVTPRTVGKWISAGRFPQDVLRVKTRGKGVVYKLDRCPALEAAELIMTT